MSESATASAPAKTQPKAKKNRLSSGFFRFVLTRFLLIIPTVFILVTIVFFVMRATGDPISAAMGGRLTPEELQRRIHAAGYDSTSTILAGCCAAIWAPRSPTTSRSPPS